MNSPAAIKPQPIVILPDPVDWINREFLIPEGDGCLHLEDYRAVVLREALRKYEDGTFVYSTVVWGDIKKSAKSTIAGAVALYVAMHNSWSSIKIVANDLKQADSREAYYIRRAIELRSDWDETIKVKPSGYLVELPNHSKIESVPVDPKGEAGGNDDLVIYTELWAAKDKAALRMWTETTLSPFKFGRSQRWVETYAGFDGESPILEQLYQQGVRDGKPLKLEGAPEDLEIYVNEQARLLVMWNTKPRLHWQSEEYYQQEAANLTPEEFNRVHRNEWQSSSSPFVPMAWWDACKVDKLPDQRSSEIVALDAAVTGDCFAMVSVSVEGGKIVPRYVRVWKPPKDGKLDFNGPDSPATELEWLVKNRRVVEVTYDPYQLHSFITEFSKKHGGNYFDFPQVQMRAVADKNLHDLIREGKIEHTGDPTLTEHLRNANKKTEKDNEKTLRLIKRASHLKIDAAVALSMAAYRAVTEYGGMSSILDSYKRRYQTMQQEGKVIA